MIMSDLFSRSTLPDVVVHTGNSNTWEAEEGGAPVGEQLVYIMTSYLKKQGQRRNPWLTLHTFKIKSEGLIRDKARSIFSDFLIFSYLLSQYPSQYPSHIKHPQTFYTLLHASSPPLYTVFWLHPCFCSCVISSCRSSLALSTLAFIAPLFKWAHSRCVFPVCLLIKTQYWSQGHSFYLYVLYAYNLVETEEAFAGQINKWLFRPCSLMVIPIGYGMKPLQSNLRIWSTRGERMKHCVLKDVLVMAVCASLAGF